MFYPPRRQTRIHPRGFSLVELLITIAVIAVLAAMLFPVSKEVMKHAAISKDLSNLRHLQAANILYSNEHEGKYVPVGSFNEDGAYGTFWHRNPDFAPVYLGVSDLDRWPDELLSPWANIYESDGTRSIERSYGYNYTGLGSYGVPGTSRNAKTLTVTNPAKTLAFADALDWQIQIYGASRYVGEETVENINANSAIAYRYDGYAGVVYFDGRAEMLSREEVIDNRTLWTIQQD
ncbi:prepilin-type N-terminal cleavage/methylation domain-containing protein [Ruficoccus sp. ZRK36]|uniref:type II secretion system protein n=1 Tax=Ruficoccus sp. ZRK36 TaxID=2866311 RepID=UPI001C732F55|nr:prepilin-type N-terminal cleavage/methylation domain-containing protein [Ruficoccus sp. ZRK36]QYY35251.1 prepilin-type N-terminal cleavage/methylation domain-containing protein [Ruficoccus sp. ZRK36]